MEKRVDAVCSDDGFWSGATGAESGAFFGMSAPIASAREERRIRSRESADRFTRVSSASLSNGVLGTKLFISEIDADSFAWKFGRPDNCKHLKLKIYPVQEIGIGGSGTTISKFLDS